MLLVPAFYEIVLFLLLPCRGFLFVKSGMSVFLSEIGHVLSPVWCFCSLLALFFPFVPAVLCLFGGRMLCEMRQIECLKVADGGMEGCVLGCDMPSFSHILMFICCTFSCLSCYSVVC